MWLAPSTTQVAIALLRLVSLLYISFGIPFRICFLTHFDFGSRYALWWVLDYASDLLLLAARFNELYGCFQCCGQRRYHRCRLHGHWQKKNQPLPSHRVLERSARSRQHILAELEWWQWNDLIRSLVYNALATAPLELVAYASGTQHSLAVFKLNRMLRLVEAPFWMHVIFKALEHRAKVEVGPLRMWLMFLFMAVTAHWAACLFYYASRVDSGSTRSWTRERLDTTWAEIDGLWSTAPAHVNETAAASTSSSSSSSSSLRFRVPVAHRYFRAYYWALVTMITTGFGDIAPITRTETAFCIVSMYVGMSITCLAIANLTLLVMSSNEAHMEHRSKVEAVRQYAAYRHLPEQTTRQMVEFIEHQWKELHGLDEGRFREELPSSLQQRCVKLKLSRLLRRLPALADGVANEAFVNSLALKLTATSYAPRDDIVRPGERLVGAVLVSQGELEVLSRKSTAGCGQIDVTRSHCVLRLREGDNFALASLFQVQQSKFLVQAHSYCEVFWLLRSVFMRVCREQCTAYQVEVMSESLRHKAGHLKEFFFAGLGDHDPACTQAANYRLRNWSKVSPSTIFHSVHTHRRRLTTGLKRVLPIGNTSPTSIWTSPRPMSHVNLGPSGHHRHALYDTPPCYHSDGPAAKDAETTGGIIGLGQATWWLWMKPGTAARDLYERIKLAILLFYAVSIPLAVKTMYSTPVFSGATLQKRVSGQKETMFLVSYACDAMLIADLGLRAMVLPALQKGVVVTSGPDIRRVLREDRVGLYCDIISLLPWDILGTAPSFRGKPASAFAWTRAAKVLVLVARLPSQATLVMSSLPRVVTKQVQRIAFLNASMLLACHWVGCFWVLAGRISVRTYDDKRLSWIFADRALTHANIEEDDGVPSDNLTGVATFSKREQLTQRIETSNWNHDSCSSATSRSFCTYLRAMYFAIVAMSTVGYGDIRPHPSNLVETNFTSAVILFGGLLLPSVVGGLASLMADLNKGVREYRSKLAEMYLLMQRLRLGSALQYALLQYVDYVWTRQKGVDELAVLADLPAPMRRNVLNKTIGPAFSAAPFFSRAAGVEDVAREELVARLEPRVFLPGDVVLAENDLSRLSMFLIERGNVDLYAARAGMQALEDARKRLVMQLELGRAGRPSDKSNGVTHVFDRTRSIEVAPVTSVRTSSARCDGHSPAYDLTFLTESSIHAELYGDLATTAESKLDGDVVCVAPMSTKSPALSPAKKALPRLAVTPSSVTRTCSARAFCASTVPCEAPLAPSIEGTGKSETLCVADAMLGAPSPISAATARRGSGQTLKAGTTGRSETRMSLGRLQPVLDGMRQRVFGRSMHRLSMTLGGALTTRRPSDDETFSKGSGASALVAKNFGADHVAKTMITTTLMETKATDWGRRSLRRASSSVGYGIMTNLQTHSRPTALTSRSKRRVLRLSRKLVPRPLTKRIPRAVEKPVLKALCIPVMRRHAGDYFGAECLLETYSTYHDTPASHWSNALRFAAETASLMKCQAKVPIGSIAVVAANAVAEREARRLKESRRRGLEGHLKCAPNMSTVATSYTDCYELHRSQFFDVLRGFPSSATVIKEALRRNCSCESRRVKAVVQNIVRIHFSNQFARRIKYNGQSDCFSYVTAAEDEFCKLAIYPDALSTVSARSLRRGGGSQLIDDGIVFTFGRRTSIDFGGSRTPRYRGVDAKSSRGSGRGPCGASSVLATGMGTGAGPDIDRTSSLVTSKARGSVNEMRLSAIVRDIARNNSLRRARGLRLIPKVEFVIRRAFCDPESQPSIMWSGVMVVATLYQVFSTPIHVAFLTQSLARYTADWLFDIVCLADVGLRTFFVGYMQHGRLIVDQRKITEKQRRSGALFFDIVVSFPYDLLALAATFGSNDPHTWRPPVLALSRVPKLARAVRLSKLMYAARSLFDAVEARIGNHIATLARLLGAVLLVSHIAACAFLLLARYQFIGRHASAMRWRCTWIRAQISNGFLRLHSGYQPKDQPEQYLRALNWALPTLVVVVIGDVTPATCKETLFVFCCIALGMSVNAMIVGQVVAVVANSDASLTEISMKADHLDKFMQQHRVPHALRSRINTFMNSLQMTSESHDPITGTPAGRSLAYSTLPHTLRARVCVAVRLPVLTRCPIFDACTDVLKRAIALYLTPETYSMGDLVVQFGDRGEAMHFLIRGAVRVVAENGSTVYATLKTGSFFGEGALFSNIRRMASIECVCFSGSLRLSRVDVQNQLRAFCFDQQLLLDKFNLITRRNQERNAAIQRSLRDTKNPKSRLARIIGVSDDVSLADAVRGRFRGQVGPWRRLARSVAHVIASEDSKACALLHGLAGVLALYQGINVPYRACFTLPSDLLVAVPGRMTFDYFCDCFFGFLILIRLNVDYAADSTRLDNQGSPAQGGAGASLSASTSSVPASSAPVVDAAYQRSRWFCIDMLAEIPLELLVIIATRRWNGATAGVFVKTASRKRRVRSLVLASRFNRLLRLFRLRGYGTACARYASLKLGFRLSVSYKALFTVALCYGMCNHWYACVWFAIHRYLERHAAGTWATADHLATRWRHGDYHIDDSTMLLKTQDLDSNVCRVAVSDCYLRSLHMVITTISSVGYGDIKPITPLETAWQLCVVTSGACLFAGLIGAFTLLLEEIDTEGMSAFNAKLQRYEAYMRHENYPSSLRSAILAHHRHRFSRMLCIDEKALTKELTAPLRMDLLFFLHRAPFDCVEVLRALPVSTARRLADVVATEICIREDDVYTAGEIGWDIYFIFSGVVNLVAPPDSTVLDAQGRERFTASHRRDAGGCLNRPRKTTTLISRATIKKLQKMNEDSGALSIHGFSTLVERDRRERGTQGASYSPVTGELREGDHFGEYCLQFDSGVRQETAIALETLELYTVSRRDLEDHVINFESDDTLKLINDLLQVHRSGQRNPPTSLPT